MIAKTERGFDFLGYHFSPEGLAVQNTLNNFVERAPLLNFWWEGHLEK